MSIFNKTALFTLAFGAALTNLQTAFADPSLSCSPSAEPSLLNKVDALSQIAQQAARTCATANNIEKLDKKYFQVFKIKKAELDAITSRSPYRDKFNAHRDFKYNGPIRTGAEAPYIKEGFGWDVITNGTFCTNTDPLGVFMRKRAGNKPFSAQVEFSGGQNAWKRGGIAIDKNGSLKICDLRSTAFTSDRKAAARIVREECKKGGAHDIMEFMGGGSLLISKGSPISETDIRTIQKFEAGLEGEEHRKYKELIFDKKTRKVTGAVPNQNTMFVTKGNESYLVITTGVSGLEAQRAFCSAGADSAVKFDGGHGFMASGRNWSQGAISSCTFVKVKTK